MIQWLPAAQITNGFQTFLSKLAKLATAINFAFFCLYASTCHNTMLAWAKLLRAYPPPVLAKKSHQSDKSNETDETSEDIWFSGFKVNILQHNNFWKYAISLEL